MAVTKRIRKVSGALKVATCTLLSSSTITSHAADPGSTQFDSALLYYSEKDRVQVLEPVFSYKKYKQFDDFTEYRITLDSMTGASPNGATPAATTQTFTGASGQSGYTVDAYKTPMRDFTDTRIALNINSEKPLSSDTRRSTGYALSIEQDYGSAGFNTSYLKDINDKHTTLAAGAGINLDMVSPIGGAPDPLININDPANQSNGGEHEDDEEGEGGDDVNILNGEFKGTFDVLFGVTQVVNRHTLMQFNYTHGFIRGYLTDPYKVVSVVDSVSGEPALTSGTSDGIYLTEKRPESRDTNALFWKTVLNISGTVLRLSYRYYWDDWGIKSDTIDLQYRVDLGSKFYLQPHYRYYSQTAADFYRHSLTNNEPVPEFVSADFRLGEFDAETVGIKFGTNFSDNSKLEFRIEQYTQTGNSHPSDSVGNQKNYDLFPTLEASIFQVYYSKLF